MKDEIYLTNKKALKELKKNKRSIRLNNRLNKHPRIEPPKRLTLEEVGCAISHGIGVILAIVGLVLLLNKSTDGWLRTSAIIYMFSLGFMCLNSCLYHSFKWGTKVKRLWRRFDYTSIYLLIAGTFAPLQLVELGREYGQTGMTLGIIYFIIVWFLTVTGLTLTCIFGPERTRKVNFPLYFVIGWSAICMVPGWIQYNFQLFIYILVGGIVYSLGMIPFGVFRKKPVAHFLWHLFVIAGAIIHFIGLYLYVFCA